MPSQSPSPKSMGVSRGMRDAKRLPALSRDWVRGRGGERRARQMREMTLLVVGEVTIAPRKLAGRPAAGGFVSETSTRI